MLGKAEQKEGVSLRAGETEQKDVVPLSAVETGKKEAALLSARETAYKDARGTNHGAIALARIRQVTSLAHELVFDLLY
ncbi:hypothetical protein PDENDC454_10785 [Paenibacillus dendritiformis C454]|uniref:Uncharacterized protein n=1 Tax=Paenibacillus dendritiformis C454 TaxID=1131935 RepID=H3SF52_9BACL|nr:hypothetical protein PDENDC454_10785 [Paenibacillus dendritiformis C454]